VRANDGDGIDPVMRRLLAERGVDATTHRSRRLSRRIVRDADLILVSERGQIAAVEAVDPFARGKVHLLGKWRTPRSPIRMAAPRPTIARATH
jgi:protein-tyrosine phosphatase